MNLPALWLWAGYASLAFELLLLAVPSEASTFQLLRRTDGVTSPALLAVRARPKWYRLLAWAAPTVLGVALFCVPLVATIVPELLRPLGALPALQVPWVTVLGLALLTAGRALALWAVLVLRPARGTGLAVVRIAPHGPFAFSRNPGLVGMFAFYVGASLVTPCVALAVGFALYGWNMHRRVLLEEDALLHRLGPAYASYLRRVPRYLGFVGRHP